MKVQLEQGRKDLESDDGNKRNICQVFNGRKVQKSINQASEHVHKRIVSKTDITDNNDKHHEDSTSSTED